MQTIKKLSALFAGLALVVLSCRKLDAPQTFANGSAATLTASSATVAPPATDSNNVALTLTWSDPKFATDSANVKHIIQIDSAGKGFANPLTRTVNGNQKSATFIAKELNNWLLSRGYAFNVPVDVDVRLISSYANNNDRQISNTVRIKMTPYKVPPKIPLPASLKLFIVGGATDGGWNNPVPTPSQELARISETQWGGIFNLTPGSYLLLPVNGDWNDKYGANGGNNSNNPLGDNFARGGGDMASPTTAGLYKIIVDFQTGRFTVEPFTQQHGLPSQLFIVGDATPGAWANPVPVPSQQFTRLNNAQFQINSIALNNTGQYLLLPTNGDWSRKYGVNNTGEPGIGLGTKLKPEGQNMPAPPTAGNYKIFVDFVLGTYTLTKL